MIKTLETKRLIMRPFSENDSTNILKLDSNPKVHTYLGNNTISTFSEAEEIVKTILWQYQKFGIGRMVVIEKQSNSFVGWSGLKYETKKINYQNGYYDLGYRFLPEFWGKGYATETAYKSLHFGFNQMNLNKICGAADINNLASNKVLSKIGMKKLNSFFYENTKCNWYELNDYEYN